jgi:hypothetical protein
MRSRISYRISGLGYLAYHLAGLSLSSGCKFGGSPLTTIQTRSHVGSDGLLRLTLPVDVTDADLDVTVVVRRVTAEGSTQMTDEQWETFIKETAGAWQGDPLARADQGEFEKRDDWG